MDLYLAHARPAEAERAAVDALLGPPATRWEGGDRSNPEDTRVVHGGHAARARRDQLIPVLHAVQKAVGWISEGAITYVARRLTVPPAEVYGVATFYALFPVRERPGAVAHVCEDIACLARGAQELMDGLGRPAGSHFD